MITTLLSTTLSHSTQAVASLIAYLQQSAPPTVADQLRQMDLVATVDVVQAMVQELTPNKQSHHLALQYLTATIDAIHLELQSVTKLVQQHDTVWFASLRLPAVSLTRLTHLHGILDTRIRYFHLVHSV